MEFHSTWEWKLFLFFWQWYINKKKTKKMPDSGTSFANIQIYSISTVYGILEEKLEKNNNNLDKKRHKNIRNGSIHLQQWMWTGLRLLLQPTSEPSDCSDEVVRTAYCRRVRAIAWLALFMHHGWAGTPIAAHPRPLWSASARVSKHYTDTTGHFGAAARHIWQRSGGLDAHLCGSLLVAAQQDTYMGLLDGTWQ